MDELEEVGPTEGPADPVLGYTFCKSRDIFEGYAGLAFGLLQALQCSEDHPVPSILDTKRIEQFCGVGMLCELRIQLSKMVLPMHGVVVRPIAKISQEDRPVARHPRNLTSLLVSDREIAVQETVSQSGVVPWLQFQRRKTARFTKSWMRYLPTGQTPDLRRVCQEAHADKGVDGFESPSLVQGQLDPRLFPIARRAN